MPVTTIPRPPTAVEQSQAQPQPVTAVQQCRACSDPPLEPFVFDPNSQEWSKGDIVTLQESIHTPVNQLFGAPPPSSTSAHLSTGFSSAGGSTRGKERSAIIWNIAPDDPALENAPPTPLERRYLLMASYGGYDKYDRFPVVLKDYFALCVSPHDEIRPGGPHVHTTPEWQARSIWLVAIPFVSDGHVAQRWSWKDAKDVRQNDRGFRLEGDARAQLNSIMDMKMRQWGSMSVKQPRFYRWCQEEYKLFKNINAWKRHLAKKDAEKADAEHGAIDEATTQQQQTSNGLDPGAPSTSLPRKPTGSRTNSASASGPRGSTNPTVQGNDTHPAADEDAAGWTVVTHKGKSRDNNQPKNNTKSRGAASRLGSKIGIFVSGMKGRQS